MSAWFEGNYRSVPWKRTMRWCDEGGGGGARKSVCAWVFRRIRVEHITNSVKVVQSEKCIFPLLEIPSIGFFYLRKTFTRRMEETSLSAMQLQKNLLDTIVLVQFFNGYARGLFENVYCRIYFIVRCSSFAFSLQSYIVLVTRDVLIRW